MTLLNIRLAVAGFLACLALSASGQVTNSVFLRHSADLVALKAGKLVPVTPAPYLNAPYTVLYFGAGWCPDCRLFSPTLVKAYDRQPAGAKQFEVLFLSRDKTEAGMLKFMRQEEMNWPALALDKWREAEDLTNLYSGKGIPCLSILDRNGRLLLQSISDQDGKEILDELQTLIAHPLSSIQTTAAPANARREFKATRRLLHFPVRTGAEKRRVQVLVDGKAERAFEIELADARPDWWAPLDVSAWKGRTITVVVDKLPADSLALTLIAQGDTLKHAGDLYREPLRPQFHFSPQRGWNNDPNGLVFFKGEYHLFFQHNPYGWSWGNMHWGHATSRDLVRWREHGEALYPDDLGPMFSGSAVVDWKNTSGFGRPGRPPLVLIYTAAGNPFTQCLAYSLDGRTFTKYAGNPVVKEISNGNRDPKVFWHEPTRKWVMALYVGLDNPAKKDAQGKPERRDTIHFLSSPDLKSWTVTSHIDGFFECPDFFALPVDGNPAATKWVLTAANSDYMVGSFDGTTFTPETPKLKGHRGRGFYAAQTYSDEPQNRRIQVGWLQAPSPGMSFNQAMSLPLELKLANTAEGPRLSWTPVRELASLRAKSYRFGPMALQPGDPNPLATNNAELVEVRLELEPGPAETTLIVRGATIAYDGQKQELVVNGHRAPAPLRGSRQHLTIYCDRTTLEIFASDGQTYVPMPFTPKRDDRSLSLQTKAGPTRVTALEIHELKSAWE